jgi:hypothetical protein
MNMTIEMKEVILMSETSTCEICGAEIDLSTDGWMESDTGGDICAECVEDAECEDDE